MPGIRSAQRGGRQVIEHWQIDVEDYVQDLAWSSDGQFVAIITVEGQVWVCHHADQVAVQIGEHKGGGTSLSWRPGTTEFSTIGHDGFIRHWNAANGSLLMQLESGASWGTRVAWKSNSQRLASAAGKLLRLFTAEGKLAYESSDHASTIADIAWNPDGSAIAAAAYFGVTLHIPGKGVRQYEWKGSSLVLSWSPTAKYLVTGEQDSSVHIWYVKTGKDSQMTGFATKVLELSWHRSGDYLATGGSDSIILWDCSGAGPEGREPRMLEAHATRLTQLTFQSKGDDIASADADGIVMLWTPLKSSEPYFFRGFDSMITRMAWSPDDQRLAVGERDGKVTSIGFQG